MVKINKNNKGFTALETGLVVMLIVALGAVGYLVYKNHNKTTTPPLATTSSTKHTTVSSTGATNTPSATLQYLVIKEWGVKISTTSLISDATYSLAGNTAWLSTKSLNANAQCVAYYTSGSKSFQGIVRYLPSDKVDVLDTPNLGDNYMTASHAVSVEPNSYRQVGSYVYFYEQGNGQPCLAQTAGETSAFSDAFMTIAVE